MKKFKREKYTLLEAKIPTLQGNTILTDPNVGGQKLKMRYEKRLVYCVRIKIPIPKWIKGIPNNSISIEFDIPASRDYEKEIMYFLRPYKSFWGEKNKLPTNFWGKKLHPLTWMHVVLEYDYDSLGDFPSFPMMKYMVEDQVLAKHLRQIKSFSLYNQINN
jgi:hypothetical protein